MCLIDRYESGTKDMVVNGDLEMHGQSRTAWVKLGATALAGASQLQLSDAVDWRAGDQVVVTSSDLYVLTVISLLIATVLAVNDKRCLSACGRK